MKCFLSAIFLFFYCHSSYSQSLAELTDIETISETIHLDIKYATKDNFVEQPVYDCAKCYLRPEVAQALYLANQYFCEKGYFIKVFDCYRPIAAQKKLWKIYPNPMYVANPYTKGSIHSRAAAIDLTLVDEEGCELDMGSPYDFFGKASHNDNYNLPKHVLENRSLLKEGLAKFGFSTIRTEWWHFTYKHNYRYESLDTPFKCL